MAIICMAVCSNEENGRLEYTKRTLESLLETVDFTKHRLGIYLNAVSYDTESYIRGEFHTDFGLSSAFPENLIIRTDKVNVGTAKAVSAMMSYQNEGEYIIKMDDDCIVNKTGWIEEMEEVLDRMPQIGILGLKRRDLAESTYRTDWAKSTLIEVPHEPGQKVYVVERCAHIIGTCTMFSKRFTNEIGALVQPSIYGMDDFLACRRGDVLGLWNCFLMGVDILHIDEGNKTPENSAFTKFKQDHAGTIMQEANVMADEYKTGKRLLFVPFK